MEDSHFTTALVRKLIQQKGLSHRTTLLSAKTPSSKLKAHKKGVNQRNAGLEWIRKQKDLPVDSGVVYFMDDDNTYSTKLFTEMSKIEKGKVGIWPVGFVGGMWVESALVDSHNSRVIGFNSQWAPKRKFPVDMAAFAVSLILIKNYPDVVFDSIWPEGHQETNFLSQFISIQDLQPLANNCREVLVWHSRSAAPKLDKKNKSDSERIFEI